MHDDPFEHGHGGDEDPGLLVASDGYPINPDWLRLTSVGIDIGSSTSHLMFSKLIMRRKGMELSSQFEVVHREVLYRSPILLTPYTDAETIDTASLDAFIKKGYRDAEIEPEDVDTGAVICTGEAVRKQNSEAIIRMLSAQGGRFVCATAGPNLEAVLGAHGSGAVVRSHDIRAGLNVDIGGGTAKLALVQNGKVTETMAINVGARLVAWDNDGKVTRVEHAGEKIAKSVGVDVKLGAVLTDEQKTKIAERLADILIEAIERKGLSPLAQELLVTSALEYQGPVDQISFSGGVAEYVYEFDEQDYGDLGPKFGAAVRTRLPRLGIPVAGSAERIRATVIGASQYTVQMSSSTVYLSKEGLLPVLDLQVIPAQLPTEASQLSEAAVTSAIAQAFERFDAHQHDGIERRIAVALMGPVIPTYDSIRSIAAGIKGALNGRPDKLWTIVLGADVAGLVGSMLKREMDVAADIVVVDGIQLGDLDFIDVGQTIESVEAIPVVVKSLVFEG